MNKRKIVVAALAVMMVAVLAVGGTVAWLADTTTEVTNTFTPSNVTVDLKETGTDDSGNKSFQIIPSVDIEKDPTVDATGDVAYYVFVKVTPGSFWTVSGNNNEKYTALDGKVSCSIDSAWKKVNTTDGTYVYYITKAANAAVTAQKVLTDNTITVANTLKETEMTTATMANNTLKFQAYVIQQQNGEDIMTPEAAWALLQQSSTL